jgi:uncharacterized protein
LFIYRNVLQDEIGQTFLRLTPVLGEKESKGKFNLGGFSSFAGKEDYLELYSKLFYLLAEEAVNYEGELVGDAWQNHLLDRILEDVNPFSVQAGSGKAVARSIQEAAKEDLATLQKLFKLDTRTIGAAVTQVSGVSGLPSWDMSSNVTHNNNAKTTLKRQLRGAIDWRDMSTNLSEYYAKVQIGASDFVRYNAFRWQRENGNKGYFEPILQIDEVHLENLIGYDQERKPFIDNTEQFLAGLPANNALLYGARGTGKSSTIKGLLTRYADKGLRLIEVHKDWLGDYPLIVKQIRNRPEKFILFVDDLSFEADEIGYKELKAVLEGSLEAKPPNLLIYATSNRRHLIKEQFSDNPELGEQNEIQAWDTVEEKLSLADRFGLVITFTTPNQRQYLAIVYGLAEQAGIKIPQAELRIKALQWEMSHSGRSGRVARQFIDQLSGQLGLTEK